MIRVALLGALLVSLAPAPARADAMCAKTEKAIAAWFRGVDAVGREGVEVMTKCMFNGPNDKAIEALAPKVKKAFAPPKLDSAADRCVKAGDPVGIAETVGHSAGQRLGLAWGVCSTKAKAHAEKRAKEGASVETIKKEVGELAQAWMGALLQ